MATNDDIEDALTRHQVFLQRYARGREQEAEEYVLEMVRQAETRIGFDFAELSKARQDRIIADILGQITEINSERSESFVSEMMGFLEYELDFNVRAVDVLATVAAVAVPALAQAQAAMLARIMNLEPNQGYTIQQALRQFGTNKAAQIVQIIRDGVTLGQPTPTIVQNIQSAAPMMMRQAATLARTVTNHVSIMAREVIMRENKDIIDRYKWVATLDSRTSLICASRDGKIYKDIDENPKPPAHFNCRSTIIPLVRDEFDLGLGIVGERPQVGARGPGVTRGDTVYEQWLRRQPRSFQINVLGVTRAKLFYEGKLSIGRFVDNSGRTLTLAELRELEPLTFERLGI